MTLPKPSREQAAYEQFELPLLLPEPRCATCPCRDGHDECDFTCTAKPDLYVRRVREVDGLELRTWPELTPTTDLILPQYVPVLDPVRLFPDVSAIKVAAVTLYDLLPASKGQRSCASKFRSGVELRQSLNCSPATRLLLSGVDHDRRLELFWRFVESGNLARELSRLDIDAVTIPNFSFFEPMPEDHARYNFRRMQIVATSFADAGIRVIPHVNATRAEHWDIWADLLQSQPGIAHVCAEFQTGNRLRRNAEHEVAQLLRLQDKAGRPLSLIIVGGRQHLDLFVDRFRSVTLVDSQVMMQSVMSRRAVWHQCHRLDWRSVTTRKGQSLKALFLGNLATYRAETAHRLSSPATPIQTFLLLHTDLSAGQERHVA